jgi:hypothetical protein
MEYISTPAPPSFLFFWILSMRVDLFNVYMFFLLFLQWFLDSRICRHASFLTLSEIQLILVGIPPPSRTNFSVVVGHLGFVAVPCLTMPDDEYIKKLD